MDPKDYGRNGRAQDAQPRIGERIDSIGDSAQRLVDDAKGAVEQIADAVDITGRVQRHPYGVLFAAFGVGYVLGGGLFTPTTARVFRLGLKLAAIPLVKNELLGMAEAAVDGLTGRHGDGGGAYPSSAPPTASTPHKPEGGTP